MPDFEEICQEHESWLNDLEGLAVEALASGCWTAVFRHVSEKAHPEPLTLEDLASPEDYQETVHLIAQLLNEAKPATLPGTST